MIQKIIKDINLRDYFPLPLWCFPLGNLNCNDDCLTCLGYPTVSHFLAQNWWDENEWSVAFSVRNSIGLEFTSLVMRYIFSNFPFTILLCTARHLNNSNLEKLRSSWLFILIYKRSTDTLFFLLTVSLLLVTVCLRLTVFLVGALLMLFLLIFFAHSTGGFLIATFISSAQLTLFNTLTALWRVYFPKFKRSFFTTGANVPANPLKVPPIP